MKFSLLAGLALAGLVHGTVLKRVVSPDNTCGGTTGYICPTGTCCSASGYCGTSDLYCGDGCQQAFSDATCTAVVAPVDPNLCGPQNNNAVCGANSAGLCCSQYGYCGSTTDHCDASTCQAAFGTCGTTTGGGDPGAGTGQCGAGVGSCPTGQCCSPSGYCGVGIDYCSDPNCQYQYGTCDSSTTPAGPGTANIARPKLGSVSYSSDIYDCVTPKVVGLSFDDGPSAYTNDLLDTLAQYGAKATFFITGNNNGKGPIDTTAPFPDVIKRMISEGHQVASHTWSHYNLSSLNTTMRYSQMQKNEQALVNIIGKFPTYMRPPFSECNAACQTDMAALGYHRVYFDLDTTDTVNYQPSTIQGAKDIVRQALASAGANDDYLSIQHDIIQQSVYNLTSYYLQLISNKGWKAVTVGDCLGDPQANWYRSGTPAGGVISSTTSSTTTRSSTTTSSTITTKSSTTTSSSTTKSSTTTSSSTTKSSTTTSSSTTRSTTTTSSSTTRSSTTTSASPTATPVSKCLMTAGSFCGQISTFNSQKTCQSAVVSCGASLTSCYMQNGWTGIFTCPKWQTSYCTPLAKYCTKCGNSCSLTGFTSSL